MTNPYSIKKLPTDILQETAQKHRLLRKQHKISQSLLATKSGVSLGSIKRFERTGKISFLSLLKLAQILDRLSDFESILSQGEDMSKIDKLFSDKTRY